MERKGREPMPSTKGSVGFWSVMPTGGFCETCYPKTFTQTIQASTQVEKDAPHFSGSQSPPVIPTSARLAPLPICGQVAPCPSLSHLPKKKGFLLHPDDSLGRQGGLHISLT